ncbi:MAG TPA: ABC transporter permease [Nocardioides sp.]
MTRLLLGRLGRMVPLLLLITLGAFSLVLLLPGDPAVTLAGDNPTPDQIERIREVMGLDRPIYAQYVDWLAGVIRGDFGESLYSGAQVTDLIMQRLPVTAWLTVFAISIAITVGVPAGIYAAARRGSWVDRALTVFMSVGIAVPAFWLGLVLITVFAVNLGVFPAGGYVPISDGAGEWFLGLALPAATLAAAPAAELARHTRSAMITVLEQDYVRTARSKGTRERVVLFKHALKNAASPVVTILSFQIAFMLGGSAIVEQIFGLPGMGSLAIQAVYEKDFPILQGVVVVAALIVMIINLLTDALYGWLNPKVRAL